MEHWSEHTRQLPALAVGDHVRIQNQIERNPRKWDKTEQIIEVRQHNQYIVCIDGSSRVSLRNRKILRKISSFIHLNRALTYNNPAQPHATIAEHTNEVTPATLQLSTTSEQDDRPPGIDTTLPVTVVMCSQPARTCEPEPSRRSTPTRQPPKWQTSGDCDMTSYIHGAE